MSAGFLHFFRLCRKPPAIDELCVMDQVRAVSIAARYRRRGMVASEKSGGGRAGSETSEENRVGSQG